MIIGILKETKDNELRVAATPDVVKNLIKLEHSVVVEKSAGEGSFISDENFKDAGADLLDSSNDVCSQADIIFSVNSLSSEQLKQIKKNSTIVSFFQIKDEMQQISDYTNNNLSLI